MENNNQLSNQIKEFKGFLNLYQKYVWILYLAIAFICVLITANINAAEAYRESLEFQDVFDLLKDKSLSFEKSDINTINTLRVMYYITWAVMIEGFVVGVINLINYKKSKPLPLIYNLSYGIQILVVTFLMYIFHDKWASDFYMSKESCATSWLTFIVFAIVYILIPVIYIYFNKLVKKLEEFEKKNEANAQKN